MAQPLWSSLAVLKTSNINLPYDPVILLLSAYPRKMKIHVQTKTCK